MELELINKMAALISKMADKIYYSNEDESTYSHKDIARAALAVIQKDYVLVRKEAVAVVDNDNITPHIGDLKEQVIELEKQLARLDDVEGLLEIIHHKGNCCQTLNESKVIAEAVINYIKGGVV